MTTRLIEYTCPKCRYQIVYWYDQPPLPNPRDETCPRCGVALVAAITDVDG